MGHRGALDRGLHSVDVHGRPGREGQTYASELRGGFFDPAVPRDLDLARLTDPWPQRGILEIRGLLSGAAGNLAVYARALPAAITVDDSSVDPGLFHPLRGRRARSRNMEMSFS